MSYYHIKNIKMDQKNNIISADLADSCWEPLTYSHIEDLYKEGTFEEKYEKLISNIIVGNLHPLESNKLSILVMNPLFSGYYDDMHDLGVNKTYQKYKSVINGVLTDNVEECIKLKSDRELNPDKYYVLHKIDSNKIKENTNNYYENQKGELYCLENGNLKVCSTSKKNYGYPLYIPFDQDKFIEYNEFLKENKNEESMEL